MTMTDMLLQMTLQNSWQLPQISQPSQAAGPQNKQGSRFQSLLEQRKEQLSQTQEQPSGSQPTAEDAASPEAEEKPAPGQQEASPELLASAAAPMMLDIPVLPAQQAAPLEGALPTAVPQIQAEASAVPALAGQLAQPQPSTQQPAQATQVQEVPSQPNAPDGKAAVQAPTPLAATAPQQEEAAAAPTFQSQAQDRPGQEFAQSQPSPTPGQELENAVVEHWQAPLFQDVEAAPVRVGDAVVDMSAPAQEVETSLANVLKSAMDQGEQQLTIKLSPANLGTVVAEFTRTPQGVLHVVLHAETEQTAKLLGDHASSLGLLLQDSGRGQVRVEVPQPQQGQQLWQQNQENSHSQQQQQQQQQQQHAPRQETETFLHQLRLGLVGRDAYAV